jgi:hypothetical protein
MGTIVKGAGLARDGANKHPVTVALSELAVEALAGDPGDAASAPSSGVENALRCYLGDKDAGRAAWPYPDFLRGSESPADVEVAIDVDEDLWHSFEAEATSQGVPVNRLVEHAAFYFAAELDAGRLTQRILEDLDSTEGDERA